MASDLSPLPGPTIGDLGDALARARHRRQEPSGTLGKIIVRSAKAGDTAGECPLSSSLERNVA
jgi:hypothetical protein